jgi:protein O-mannosyl-transferase
MAAPDPGSRGRVTLAMLLIVAAIAASYLSSLGASFQFDDWNVVVHDERVQSLSAWWHSMPGIRPITKLSYALNHNFSDSVEGFRTVNLLVHLGASLLVLFMVMRTARGLGWSESASRRGALWVALVFAVHPVQTEAVTYISGRSGSLAAMFALASLAAWSTATWRKWLSAALYLLAMGCKETAIVLPLALLLLVGLHSREPHRWRIALRNTALHWLLAAAALGAMLLSPVYRQLLAISLSIRSISDNLLTQSDALFYLIGQLLRLDELNADPWLVPITAANPTVVLECALLAGTLLAGLAMLRRRPAWAFGILWFAIWILPTNSLLPRLDVANDRQLYLPLIGVAWLLACAVHALPRGGQNPMRTAVAGLATLYVVTLMVATVQRNRVYATELTFWSDVVSKSPDNARAANNLGYALAQECRDVEAQVQLVRAVQLDPASNRARVNLRLLHEGALRAGQRCPD